MRTGTAATATPPPSPPPPACTRHAARQWRLALCCCTRRRCLPLQARLEHATPARPMGSLCMPRAPSTPLGLGRPRKVPWRVGTGQLLGAQRFGYSLLGPTVRGRFAHRCVLGR